MEGLYRARKTELPEHFKEGAAGSNRSYVGILHAHDYSARVISRAHAGHGLGHEGRARRRLFERLQIEGLDPALLDVRADHKGIVSDDAAAHLRYRDACRED